ncbi:MAG: hypothetical protein WBP81_14945, partial [Solirubrobacteraceae bacterium]
PTTINPEERAGERGRELAMSVPATARAKETVELGVEKCDERATPGNSAEHREARAVMGELGIGLGFVTARRSQQRELPDLGDLVSGENRDRVRGRARDAGASSRFRVS